MPRKPENGAAVTWTGPGFIRAFEGDIIDFQIDDIPLSLNYSVVIRYEIAVSCLFNKPLCALLLSYSLACLHTSNTVQYNIRLIQELQLAKPQLRYITLAVKLTVNQ